MSSSLSRRDFFCQLGQEVVQLAHQLLPQMVVSEQPASLPDPLLSDLPPELLADEAQRLGLDPLGEPAELARAIRRRMLSRQASVLPSGRGG